MIHIHPGCQHTNNLFIGIIHYGLVKPNHHLPAGSLCPVSIKWYDIALFAVQGLFKPGPVGPGMADQFLAGAGYYLAICIYDCDSIIKRVNRHDLLDKLLFGFIVVAF